MGTSRLVPLAAWSYEVSMITRLLAVCCCLFGGSFALADDWPQFRGPNRNGVSSEKDLLKVWPKTGPKLRWTFKESGLGFSSMAIAKGVVYTLGTDMKFQDEYVIAIDEKKGTELWRIKIAPIYTYKGNAYGDGPRSTPTIDGNLLFALSGAGQLVCIDIAGKKEVWRKHLVKDMGGVIMDRYGFSESPLVDGKHLICTPGGPNGTLAVLDKTNGKLLWRSKGLDYAAPFSSAVIADFHGVRQYVQCCYNTDLGNEKGVVAGFSAKDASVIWTGMIFKGNNDLRGIGAAPIVAGSSVYVSTDIGGCHLFEINKTQKPIAKYKPVSSKRLKNAHGGVVLVGDHIYGHSAPSMWVCQAFTTGEKEWDERIELKCVSGSVVSADDKLFLYSDSGEAGLIEASAKAFNLISKFTIPQKSTIPQARTTSRQAQVWSHPAIANGVLYLRDHELIYAYEIK
jgi:outer membrane protein assembly factor BamB